MNSSLFSRTIVQVEPFNVISFFILFCYKRKFHFYFSKMLAKLHIRNSPEKLDESKKHVIWDDLVNKEQTADVTGDISDALVPEQIHDDLGTPVSFELLSDKNLEEVVDQHQGCVIGSCGYTKVTKRPQKAAIAVQDQNKEPEAQYPAYTMPSFLPKRTLTRASQSQVKNTVFSIDTYSKNEGIALTSTPRGLASLNPPFTFSRETTRNWLMSRDGYTLTSSPSMSRGMGLGTSAVNTPISDDNVEMLKYQDGKFIAPKAYSFSERRTNSAPGAAITKTVIPKTTRLNLTSEKNVFGPVSPREIKSSHGTRPEKYSTPLRPQTTHSATRTLKTSYSLYLHKPAPGAKNAWVKSKRSVTYSPDNRSWDVKSHRKSFASGSRTRYQPDTDIFQINSVFKHEDLRSTRSFPGPCSSDRKETPGMMKARFKSESNLHGKVSP